MSVIQTSQTLLFTCDWSGEQEERLPLAGPPPSWKVISSGDEAGPVPEHMSWKEAARRLAFKGHEVKVTTVE